MDAENIGRIENLILDIQDRTVILISHQVSDALYAGVDSVYELQDGKLRCLKSDDLRCDRGGAEVSTMPATQVGHLCDVGCI